MTVMGHFHYQSVSVRTRVCVCVPAPCIIVIVGLVHGAFFTHILLLQCMDIYIYTHILDKQTLNSLNANPNGKLFSNEM